MQWMQCNTCKTTVKVNEIGICKACQAGFANAGDDSYEYYKTQEKITKTQGKIDAIEERLKQEGDKK